MPKYLLGNTRFTRMTYKSKYEVRNMNLRKTAQEGIITRFTATSTEKQYEQMQTLMTELRYSRSKIIRLAIDLLLETHKKDPKRYGV